VPSQGPNLLKLCMRLNLNVMDKFVNWVDFKFPLNSCYKFWNRFKFEYSLNFKGVQTMWEKSGKLTKKSLRSSQKCKILGFQYKCQKTWCEIKERSLSLNFKLKPHNTYNINQTCTYMERYYLNTVAVTVALGVSHAGIEPSDSVVPL
jgi:hypothetical protein